MRLKDYMWAAPFLCFTLGYYLTNRLYSVSSFATPTVVGKQLPEAVKTLSDHNLNARLLAEKIDPDLPDYTIVSQTPREGANIKAHQSVFLVLTRQPEKPICPYLIGYSSEEIGQKLAREGIKHTNYSIASNHPQHCCLGQFPRQNEPLEEHAMICYISKGNCRSALFPDLRGQELEKVILFLEEHGLEYQIIIGDKKESADLIQDQRPLPGSIVNLERGKKPQVQIYIN